MDEKVKVNWIDCNDGMPESPGIYLTYWSDGALETMRLDEADIDKTYIVIGNAVMLFWAENVAPPANHA